MTQAKAAVFIGVDQPFEIRQYPLVAPPPGMAKLKLIASGICGTDVHIHHGKIPIEPPKIIGHEFVGRVMEIAQEDRDRYGIQAGDAVIVDIACPCGQCTLCHDGDDANCLHMDVTNGGNPDVAPHFYGGYGEYNYSPVKNLIPIPETLDPAMACVFACAGPTALHALKLAKQANVEVEKAKVAVVQGLGPVGIFAVMALSSMGIPNIVAVIADNNQEREAFARSIGATQVYNLLHKDAAEITAEIRDLNAGIGADVVFEASGSPFAVPQGLAMLRNRGTYLIPGQYSNSGGVEIQPQWITFNALHIIGSSQYSVSDVQTYLQFLLDHPQLHDLIRQMASCYEVEEINQAFADIQIRKNVKTMLTACHETNTHCDGAEG